MCVTIDSTFDVCVCVCVCGISPINTWPILIKLHMEIPDFCMFSKFVKLVVSKLIHTDLNPICMPSLVTAKREWAGKSLLGRDWEMKYKPRNSHLSEDCWWYDDPSKMTLFPPLIPGRQRIIYIGPPSRPNFVAFYDMQGEGCLLLPRSSTSTLLHTPQSRSRVYFSPFRGPLQA